MENMAIPQKLKLELPYDLTCYMISSFSRAKMLFNLGVQSTGLLRTSEYTPVPWIHILVS